MLSEARKEKALKAEEGTKPKYHRGKYGASYDYWTCGNCGAIIARGVCENYCHNCGYRHLWDNPRCLNNYRVNNDESAITKQGIINMINCEIEGENKNYAKYMEHNPGDAQREHDHAVVLSVYEGVLHDLNMLFRD